MLNGEVSTIMSTVVDEPSIVVSKEMICQEMIVDGVFK